MFETLANSVTYDFLKLSAESRFAQTLDFFIADTLKILFLIFTVVAILSFIRTFFDPGKFKKMMEKSRYGLGHLAASIFGAMTPFCSCSSIPIFVGLLDARIPLGIAFAFLITSPLVNEVVFVMMGGLFGWDLALLYAVSGIFLGVTGGLILGSLKMENQIIMNGNGKDLSNRRMPQKWSEKIDFALNDAWKTFKRLWPYVIGGVFVGALIHGYVPEQFFVDTVGKYEALSVPIAVLIGIPIYAGCSMVVPLIFSITANGVPLGTSLAFMMAIAGLSFPEAIILKRVMTLRLLAVFFGLVGVGIIAIGYLFNFVGLEIG